MVFIQSSLINFFSNGYTIVVKQIEKWIRFTRDAYTVYNQKILSFEDLIEKDYAVSIILFKVSSKLIMK